MLDQIHRELAYADSHLPRWRYVPEAALRRRGLSMRPDLFLADLHEKPARLRELTSHDAWGFVAPPARVLLVGMGSSHYANLVAPPGSAPPASPRWPSWPRPTCCLSSRRTPW